MAQNDEFDLRELLGDGDEHIVVPDINALAPEVPASELAEVESTLKSVQCWRCSCFMIGMLNGDRVCRHHKDHPKDPACPDCARRRIMNAPGYIENGHHTERLPHPLAAPVVVPVEEKGSSPVVSEVRDLEIDEVTTPAVKALNVEAIRVPEDELTREYYEVFNETVAAAETLEPEDLQERRHRNLRLIRRAKIQNQAFNYLMEGKLQLVDAKRRRAIQEKDAEFMKQRAAQKAVEGDKPKKSSSTTGMSAAEKQIKQFCKLNMPDQAIIDTLKAVGTGVPENVAELIAKHRK